MGCGSSTSAQVYQQQPVQVTRARIQLPTDDKEYNPPSFHIVPEFHGLCPPSEFLIQSPARGAENKAKGKKERSSHEPSLPTPNQLLAAQREHAARGERPSIDPATGVLGPFPPPTTKDEVFKPQDYQHADKTARTVPQNISCGPLQRLVNYLIQGTMDNIRKVRAFFVWIAQQTYPTYRVVDDSRLDIAYNKLALARYKHYNYAMLLAEMCSCAGIPCKKIRGCAKGFDNEDVTDLADDNHTWCAVYVNGAWRFIDPQFGSRSMTGGRKDWKVVDTDLEVFKNRENQEAEMEFQLDEDYFLTDPERFIYNHFPRDAEWQLLVRPVTKDEYSIMAKISHEYFKWNLLGMSEPKGDISTNTGVVDVTFTVSPDSSMRLSYVLFKHTDTDSSQDSSKRLNQLVRLENRNKEKNFQICFKEIGLYKLEIYVPKADGKPHMLTTLVAYFIRCNCPYFNEVENPRLPSGLQELGPASDWKTIGIRSSLQGGVIQAYQGCAKLQLTDNGKFDYLFQLLRLNNLKDDKELTTATLVDKQQNQINLYVKLPSHGNFLLEVYTGPLGERRLQHSSNFIISSDMECITEPFPLSLNGSVGNAGNQRRLIPTTTTHSYLSVEEQSGDLILQFTIVQECFFMTKLIHHRDGTETDLKEYTCCEKVGDLLQCHLRFPQYGIYVLEIFAKEKASMKMYSSTWKYLLEVQKPTDCLPFPETLPDWKQNMVLASPCDKYLTRNTEYNVELTVPRASRVYVEKWGENVTTELQEDGNGRWQATVNSLSQTEYLIVFAEFPGIDGAKQLLCYEVTEASTLEAKHAEYEDEVHQANNKHTEVKKRLHKAISKSKQRSQEATMKSKVDRQKFEKAKTELFANEAELEKKAMAVRFKRKLLEMEVTSDTVVSLQRLLTDVDVQAVVIAVMILLGHREERVSTPADCQKMIRAIGAESIVQQMMVVDVLALPEPVLTRATELLQGVNQHALKEDNPIARLAYDWVRGCLNFHAVMAVVGK